MQVTDKEVIAVMKDGGLKLVEYAKIQWLSGKYDTPGEPELNSKMRRENLERWSKIERRIPELARLLKEVVQK